MNNLTIKPGDVVRFDGDESYDVLVKPGDRAVVDTAYFDPDGDGEILVCFRASAFRDENARIGIAQAIELSMTNTGLTITMPIVSCSGGPAPFVKVADLTYVGTTVQAFWKWKDRPRAGGGEHYTETVNMWSWKGRTK